MILKIKKDSGYITIDDIQEVEVDYALERALAYAGLSKSGMPSIGFFGKYRDSDDILKINRGLINGGGFLFDTALLTCQIADKTENPEDSTDKDKCWQGSHIKVIYRNESIEWFIALRSQDIFILNDNGKTIDRY